MASWHSHSFHSSANFLLLLLFFRVSVGSGVSRRFVLVVVSTGSGANLRGCGEGSTSARASFLDVLKDDSIGSAANRRLNFVAVSTSSGARFRGRLEPSVSFCDWSLEDLVVVSMGSTLNRLGVVEVAILEGLGRTARRCLTRSSSYVHAKSHTVVTTCRWWR